MSVDLLNCSLFSETPNSTSLLISSMSLYRNPLERFSDFHNHIECSSTALAPNSDKRCQWQYFKSIRAPKKCWLNWQLTQNMSIKFSFRSALSHPLAKANAHIKHQIGDYRVRCSTD